MTGQAEKGFPSAMLASTTYQSDDLTNQATLAAVASVMPAKTDRICPGLEPSLDDDAARNFYRLTARLSRLLWPQPRNLNTLGHIVNAAQHGPGYSLPAAWGCDRVRHNAATHT
eukprot:5397101-Pleurochrysis_carterae.AAC.1